ncbi:MAG: T9SS type A sorting domain-containing protein [Bacteroidales bacterium]|nr:T9SS type A sorting domain-containing protein [Bacteroidales bacterium]
MKLKSLQSTTKVSLPFKGRAGERSLAITTKLFAFLTVLLISGLGGSALQAQSWQWAKSYGGPNGDGPSKICLDQAGNLFTASTCMFPYSVYGHDTLGVWGISNIFISKQDNQGNFLWIRRAGGINNEGGAQTVWDMYFEKETNSLIMTGVMAGSETKIGSCMFYGDLFMFLSKLDSGGNCIWGKMEANLGDPSLLSIYPDSSGNIYMAGNTKYKSWFTGGISIQPGGFLAKFRADDGSLVWVKKIMEPGGYLYDIIATRTGLLVSGCSAENTLSIGGTQINCQGKDIFLSRFSLDGNLQWVKTMGGPGTEAGGTIYQDNSENIYISGIFHSLATFGTITLTNNDKDDDFLAKCDNTGTVRWVKQLHISESVLGITHNTNGQGETWLSGTFTGNAVFGEQLITADIKGEQFVAKYSRDGNCVGVIHSANAYNTCFERTENGDFFVAGSFSGITNFGINKLTSMGNDDGFIAKHDAITGIPHPVENPQRNLVIYANPTTGRCNVTIPGEFMHEKQLTLTVFDSMGKLVEKRTVTLAEGKISLNLEAQARGIYQVKLDNGVKGYVGRVVFE